MHKCVVVVLAEMEAEAKFAAALIRVHIRENFEHSWAVPKPASQRHIKVDHTGIKSTTVPCEKLVEKITLARSQYKLTLEN